MVEKHDHIGIGYSGGKDSTVLMHILSGIIKNNFTNKITLITIDEGISGYRDGSLKLTRTTSKNYGHNHIILSFKEIYGATLDQIVSKSVDLGNSLSACALCGILRRRALNYGAQQAAVTKIATGHNLDDEAQSVVMNLLRGDARKFMRLSRYPFQRFSSLIPRIRPLVKITEPEIVLYAHANELNYHSYPCPYASSAMRNDIRFFLTSMEKKRPSTLTHIVNVHDSLTQLFPKTELQTPTYLCKECKEVSTQRICPVCQLLDKMKLKISKIEI
jgi:uncharacterized protein (TIGR00269 family)